jgi:hypothetical protein
VGWGVYSVYGGRWAVSISLLLLFGNWQNSTAPLISTLCCELCVCVYLLVIIAPRDWEKEREMLLFVCSIDQSVNAPDWDVCTYCAVDTQSRHDCTQQRERQKNPISLFVSCHCFLILFGP